MLMRDRLVMDVTNTAYGAHDFLLITVSNPYVDLVSSSIVTGRSVLGIEQLFCPL
ncbi:hypothetical protein L3i20_v202150 [Paenibacillus sp. L3-i20]|nr:hypothetical protein L3i20_v202150 [Paenibacillus sp. L3-i20]